MNPSDYHNYRTQWTVVYTGAQVTYGAQKQVEYHEEKIAFWKDWYDRVFAQIKATGIEAKDGVVRVKPELEKQLLKCWTEIQEHEELVKNHANWVRYLEDQSTVEFELTHKDFVFFFNGVEDIPKASRGRTVEAEVSTPPPSPFHVPDTYVAAPVAPPALARRAPKAAKASVEDIPPMTAPPLVAKGGAPAMGTVPALGPAAAGTVFVPPDLDGGGNSLSDFPD